MSDQEDWKLSQNAPAVYGESQWCCVMLSIFCDDFNSKSWTFWLLVDFPTLRLFDYLNFDYSLTAVAKMKPLLSRNFLGTVKKKRILICQKYFKKSGSTITIDKDSLTSFPRPHVVLILTDKLATFTFYKEQRWIISSSIFHFLVSITPCRCRIAKTSEGKVPCVINQNLI
jgi:hypothetical protein